MKRVLITGANSFLGDSTKNYLEKDKKFHVDVLDMLNPNWNAIDFSKYDVVFNVSAIVHRFDIVEETIYYKVNRDLAIEIATKAKKSGVKQFIQTSTNGVFGIELGEMNSFMGFNPKTPYEKSKFEADLLLEKMREGNFKVCIIRPPMIYGVGCKGNFPRLEKFALKHNFFPSIENKRDFIYIDNLCDFIKFSIENELDEICYPRNIEVISVSKFVKEISILNGKKMYLLKILNPFVKLLYKHSHKLRSVFGDNYCTEQICTNCSWKAPYDFLESLKHMYGE